MKKSIFLIFSTIVFSSCSTLQNPGPIANSIPVYENQLGTINGVYFNNPYVYKYNYKTFLDFFEINGHNVDSLKISFVDAEHLKIISYKPLERETHIVEGKLREGTFQIKNKHFLLGIPYLFFTNSKEKIRIGVGVLDEIIVQRYHYSTFHFFGNVSEEEYTDYYRYSKTLEVIP